jgi:hypothetical protein
MPTFEIYFRCDECKGEHPIHLRIHLDDGPARKESLAAFLLRRSMPPQLAAIRGRKVLCLKTGKTFKLESDDQIFLAPFTMQFIPDEK